MSTPTTVTNRDDDSDVAVIWSPRCFVSIGCECGMQCTLPLGHESRKHFPIQKHRIPHADECSREVREW